MFKNTKNQYYDEQKQKLLLLSFLMSSCYSSKFKEPLKSCTIYLSKSTKTITKLQPPSNPPQKNPKPNQTKKNIFFNSQRNPAPFISHSPVTSPPQATNSICVSVGWPTLKCLHKWDYVCVLLCLVSFT